MKKLNKIMVVAFIFTIITSAFAQLKIVSNSRVWSQIEDPISFYNQYGSEQLVSRWSKTKDDNLKEHPSKDVLGIDLDGDGDLDHLYTSWVHNGRAGKTMTWYTINENGKHYGWVIKSVLEDGTESISMSGGEVFELQDGWKTIRLPIGEETIYGLLSEGGISHGYIGSDLVYFVRNSAGEYERKWKRVLVSQSHGEPNSEPDIRTYEDGFKTWLSTYSIESEKYKTFYQDKIGQYILTPKNQRSYEMVNSYNFYAALKESVEKKQKADKEIETIKKNEVKAIVIPENVAEVKLVKEETVVTIKEDKTDVRNGNWIYWLLGAMGLFVSLLLILMPIKNRKVKEY